MCRVDKTRRECRIGDDRDRVERKPYRGVPRKGVYGDLNTPTKNNRIWISNALTQLGGCFGFLFDPYVKINPPYPTPPKKKMLKT